MAYWIDASVLIQSHHRLFPYERDRRFWGWLDGKLDEGAIKMPRVAFLEATNGNDWLVKWCKDRRDRGLNVRPGKAVQDNFRVVTAHVQSEYQGRNMQHHIAKFLGGADPWLIAHAMQDGGTVVTQEEPNRKHEFRIKLPTVAKAMRNIRSCDTYQMLDRLKAKFE